MFNHLCSLFVYFISLKFLRLLETFSQVPHSPPTTQPHTCRDTLRWWPGEISSIPYLGGCGWSFLFVESICRRWWSRALEQIHLPFRQARGWGIGWWWWRRCPALSRPGWSATVPNAPSVGCERICLWKLTSSDRQNLEEIVLSPFY